jgi:hypothetical protein
MSQLANPTGGLEADLLTLDVVETTVLHGFPTDQFPYHQRHLTPLGGSRWLVATPTLDVHEEDFASEEVVLPSCHAVFPICTTLGGVRPGLFSDLTADQFVHLRFRAAALSLILAGPPPVAALPANDPVWLYADSAFEAFITFVPAADVASGRIYATGHFAPIEARNPDVETQWMSVGRLRRGGRAVSLSENREGAGRDLRLLGFSAANEGFLVLLWEEVCGISPAPSALPGTPGPVVAFELTRVKAIGFDVVVAEVLKSEAAVMMQAKIARVKPEAEGGEVE